jgi:hypothetical protein
VSADALRAFGGAPLLGERLVRLVYMDEAGISRDEPITVVSGIIVHGDTQLNLAEQHLVDLVKKHIPEAQRPGFVFHATHIFNGVSGTDVVFGRDNPDWPLARRLQVADDLALSFREFDLRITLGVAHRKNMAELFPAFLSAPESEAAAMMHSAAFMICSMYIEQWMRSFGDNENCLLVVENHERHRQQLRSMQRDLQNPDNKINLGDEWDHYFPFTRIREDPLFQDKRPHSILQLADFAAYVMKRTFNGDTKVKRFTDLFWQQVIFDRSLLEQPA